MIANPAAIAVSVTLLAAAICAVLIVLLRPVLQRYALARPNARSSHKIPTPQGAGIAVIGATLVGGGAFASVNGFAPLTSLFVAVPLLALVGLVVFTAPDDLRLLPIPLAIERTLLLIAGLWFVNLVNFMDGLDLMTVAEAVPVTAMLVLFGIFGLLPWPVTAIAAALGGAMLGFAPFNRPVAKVFLGDVGSLPIGLLLGWSLLQLAWQGSIAAALLLPLYYLVDATLTLLRRMARREPFWAAHRAHFYQRATDNGFTVAGVVGDVFVLNIGLAVLAGTSVVMRSVAADVILIVVGLGAVAVVLRRFSQPRVRPSGGA